MENKKQYMEQSSGRSSRRGLIAILLVVIALFGLIVLVGAAFLFITGRNVAEDVAGSAAEGAAGVAESVAEVAGEVADEVSDERILDPDRFVRVQDEYVLRPSDLPYTYYVPDGGERRYGNSVVILEMGQVEGKTYILETSRVDGWDIRMKRSSSTVIAPAVYESRVEVFETSEGAQLALSPEWFMAYTDGDAIFSEDGCDFGDQCLLYSYDDFDPASGLTTLRYDVAFVYRNVLVWVSGRGLDIDITEQDVLTAAQKVYDRLEKVELANN